MRKVFIKTYAESLKTYAESFSIAMKIFSITVKKISNAVKIFSIDSFERNTLLKARITYPRVVNIFYVILS